MKQNEANMWDKQMSMAQAEGLLAPVCTQSVRSVKQGGRTMRQVRTDRS